MDEHMITVYSRNKSKVHGNQFINAVAISRLKNAQFIIPHLFLTSYPCRVINPTIQKNILKQLQELCSFHGSNY